MNPRAYEILQKLKLPLPRIFTLEEACSGSPKSKYYLRYNNSAGKHNQVCTAAFLRKNKKAISSQISSNALIRIEAVYDFIGGGASLVKRDFVYSEYVTGHLCALLRRGLCGMRFLFTQGKLVFQEDIFQGWKGSQRVGFHYNWEPSNGPSREESLSVAELLTRVLPTSHSGLFLEWFFCDEGIFFCDTKDSGFDFFGEGLLDFASNHYPTHIQRFQTGTERIMLLVDGFDIDLRTAPEPGTQLVIHNGALLCHFITRNIQKNIAIMFGAGIKCLK